MGESFKYIEVLCDLGNPYKVECNREIGMFMVKKYYERLMALDYNKMYFESKTPPDAKKILEEWSSEEVENACLKTLTDNYITYKDRLKLFLRNVYDISTKEIGEVREMAESRGIDFFADEDMKNLKWLLDTVLCEWCKRLNQLLFAYGYTKKEISQPHTPKKRPDDIVKMFDLKMYCDEFFDETSDMKMNSSQWGKRATKFIKEKKLNLYWGDQTKLWRQLMTEHPQMRDSVRTFRQQIPKQLLLH